MATHTLTVETAREANIEVITNGRGTQALHDMVVALRANRRSGTANCKTKAEVNLSGRKPWKQKGTGRARAGYFASPIWRGGGVVFGPKPRDYSKKVTKSVRKLAFLKALSARIVAGDVLTVETFGVSAPKTKEFIAAMAQLTDAEKVLVIGSTFDENTYKAARNVQKILLERADEVTAEQLLAFQKIIIVGEALGKLAERSTK